MSKLVPKLRFDGFSGEWKDKKLNEICNINPTIDKLPNNFIYIDLESVVDGKLLREKEIQKENSPSRAQRLLQKNDVIYQMVRPYQKNNLFFNFDNNKDYVASTGYAQLRAFDSNSFLYQLLHVDTFVNKVLENSTGSNYPAINSKDLAKITVVVPKPKEQQKIANCLSSLDNLIESQNKKVEALKKHKKGLMQQLFPKDGEKEPKLRFDGFSGEWEEKKLGEVIIYENGKAHEQDIQEIGKYIVVNSKFISTDGEVKKYTDTAFCLAKKDEVLMVLSDVPNGRAIAKCFLVDTNDFYTVNQRICKISSSKVISTLLFYILNRNKYFLDFDDGVKQTNLKKDDVLSCPILLPKDKQEQQKIANCLSSLDSLIESQSKKIEALKKHKKGLMQQLFVSSEG